MFEHGALAFAYAELLGRLEPRDLPGRHRPQHERVERRAHPLPQRGGRRRRPVPPLRDRRDAGQHLVEHHTHRVDQAVQRFVAVELMHGFRDTIKRPHYGVVPAVCSWSEGATIDELQNRVGNDGGDVVRTMRMAIMMMRQLRGALSGGYPLIDRLQEAIVGINRDEVDAKRQFELG